MGELKLNPGKYHYRPQALHASANAGRLYALLIKDELELT
jgi:hypothetical protein